MVSRTKHYGILRSAAALATLSISLSLPADRLAAVQVVEHAHYEYAAPSYRSEAPNAAIGSFYREARECYVDGHWDIRRLRRIQYEYFSYVDSRPRQFMTNGVHDSTLGLMPVIAEVARREHIDPDVIAGVIEKESQGYIYTIGNIGELGLMQINPHAYPDILSNRDTYRNIFDPETNISIGTKILKECLRESHGSMRMALAIYNVGYGRICRHRSMGIGRQYGSAVLRYSESIDNLLRTDNR